MLAEILDRKDVMPRSLECSFTSKAFNSEISDDFKYSISSKVKEEPFEVITITKFKGETSLESFTSDDVFREKWEDTFCDVNNENKLIPRFNCNKISKSDFCMKGLTKAVKYKSGKSYRCIHCDVFFGYKGDLKRHIESKHLNIRAFHCYYCTYSGARKSSLQKHIIVRHLREKIFGCHFCPYKGGSKYHLMRHENSVHTRNLRNNFNCAYCFYKCKLKRSIRKHINERHSLMFINHPKLLPKRFQNMKKLFECNYCEYYSKRPGRLQDHIFRVHHHSKPYCCKLCSYKTSNRELFQQHIRDSHYGINKCKLCSFTFKTSASLKSHLRRKHFRMESKMLFCVYCLEAFYCKSNLKGHIKLKHRSKFS